MTAEIAIINRGAITLATDSAVTLKVRGNEKIYNCADKLFELSDQDPLGVMVYNNLEFMGVSLEVAVKQFRTTVARAHFKSVVEAAEAFFGFLLRELHPDGSLQQQHARAILQPVLISIRKEFERAATSDYESRRKKKTETDYAVLFTQTVKKHVESIEQHKVSECFDSMTEADIAAFYKETIDSLLDEAFKRFPLEDDHKELLRRACVLTLHRDTYSESLTGLVFAGFGEHEMFPSLVAYQIDGVIGDKLKRRETDRVIATVMKFAAKFCHSRREKWLTDFSTASILNLSQE